MGGIEFEEAGWEQKAAGLAAGPLGQVQQKAHYRRRKELEW